MSTPALLYRQLSPDGDPVWGNGQANFLTDAEALTLLLNTRLKLYVGEWWADTADGLWLPLTGPGLTPEQKALAIQQRVLATAFVTGMTNMEFGFVENTRQFFFSAEVQTQFGVITVSSGPQA